MQDICYTLRTEVRWQNPLFQDRDPTKPNRPLVLHVVFLETENKDRCERKRCQSHAYLEIDPQLLSGLLSVLKATDLREFEHKTMV